MNDLLRDRFEPLVCGEILGVTQPIGLGALAAVSCSGQGKPRGPDSAINGYY